MQRRDARATQCEPLAGGLKTVAPPGRWMELHNMHGKWLRWKKAVTLARCCEHVDEYSGCIKCGEFLEQLRNYQHLKRDSASEVLNAFTPPIIWRLHTNITTAAATATATVTAKKKKKTMNCDTVFITKRTGNLLLWSFQVCTCSAERFETCKKGKSLSISAIVWIMLNSVLK